MIDGMFLDRYLRALMGRRKHGISLAQPQQYEGYGFTRRYVAALLGVRLPSRSVRGLRDGGASGQEMPEDIDARMVFLRHLELPKHSQERAALRSQLVRLHLPLAERLAGRFDDHGESVDGLLEAAVAGLGKAVDRFDPRRGGDFSTYAVPAVVGEVKRHLLTKGWPVRAAWFPELQLAVAAAASELRRLNGRPATVSEVSQYLDISVEDVGEDFGPSKKRASAPTGGRDDSTEQGTTLSRDTDRVFGIENSELARSLSPRERQVLSLSAAGMPVDEIAHELAISRKAAHAILSSAFRRLRLTRTSTTVEPPH
ncbi:sigma-70 family RNA polymerase sigma factor [Streptomyces sp.]|uniref:sigma-70 family RNA polymerase sigma factor n=1 Tax=Streptomyces sp. TaxID=1931 RepID=UPI002D775DE6|nr:sigma-70 family RNA polymerase sigma factor [Streptomyces sp.]HET6353454.1 sigma-70 family RNA polymerase sigma factor [Streptomyces sp.]